MICETRNPSVPILTIFSPLFRVVLFSWAAYLLQSQGHLLRLAKLTNARHVPSQMRLGACEENLEQTRRLFVKAHQISPRGVYILRLSNKCGWRGGTYGTHPLTFMLWFFLIYLFLGMWAICFLFKKTIIENFQFAVQIEIVFCRTSTFSGSCSSDHQCMKIVFLVGFLGLGVF